MKPIDWSAFTVLDWITFASWALLAITCFVIAWYQRRQRQLESQDRIEGQYDLLNDQALARVRIGLPTSAMREAWRRVEPAILESTGGFVRQAHVYWLIDHVRSGLPLSPIPNFSPPAGTPYRAEADSGMAAIAQLLRARRAGVSVPPAVASLRALAEAGSPLAMTQYGVVLIRGWIPGEDPDPAEGQRWLERSVATGLTVSAPATLGKLLLHGDYLTADPERGAALLLHAAERGHEPAAMALCAALMHGRYGLPQDPHKAVDAALITAPAWRRRLAALGISQMDWCRQELADFMRLQQLIDVG